MLIEKGSQDERAGNKLKKILGQLFGVLASTPSIASPQGVDIILILGQDSAASVEATG